MSIPVILTGKKSNASQIAITLSTEWSGDAAPFTQTVSVSGVTVNSTGYLDLAPTASLVQREAARDALIYVASQSTDSLTIIADGDKPTVTIPCILTLL